MKPLIYLFLLTAAFATQTRSLAQNTFNALAVRTNLTVAGAPPVLTVNTLADVITFQPQGGRVVQTRGYHTAGDGGHGTYRWTTTIPSTTNTYGGVLAVSGGAWIQVDRPYKFPQFGVRQDGLESSGEANRARIQSALQFLRTGGEIELPKSSNITWVGPEAIRPNANLTNLTITLNGNISVPGTNNWNAGHPFSLFHFSDAGTYNNVVIQGSGILDGNALNQPTDAADNYGKMMGIRFDFATNCVVRDITIRNFGFFAFLAGKSKDIRVTGTTIIQTNGNNDSRAPGSWGRNADGLHFDMTSGAIVDGNDIKSTDDCVAFTIVASDQTMTNIVVANNRLQPFAPSATYIPVGIRVATEPGITNSRIDNIAITGNVIDAVGANGMYIGAQVDTTRSHAGVLVSGNVIRNAGNSATVLIGPDAGDPITFSAVTSGGIQVFHCDDATISGNTFLDIGERAICTADSGTVTITGNTFRKMRRVSGSFPGGSGVYIPHGNLGPVDYLTIKDNVFDELDGSAVITNGSTHLVQNFVFAGNNVSKWNLSRAAATARVYPAVFMVRAVTNAIVGNVFGTGFASGLMCFPAGEFDLLIRDNVFTRIEANQAVEGASEWIRSVGTTGGTRGRLVVENNMFGYYTGFVANVNNFRETIWNNNTFSALFLPSNVSADAVRIDFETNVVNAARIVITDNKTLFMTKVGNNPSSLFRVYNNLGSGGSLVTLTSQVSGNSTDGNTAPWIDAFQSHNIDLAYSGTTVTVNPYGRDPYQFRLTLTNNATLSFANFFHGMRGSIYMFPAATNCVITTPSNGYTPTGATFTVDGGTGNTNMVRAAFEVIGVGGTNRIAVIPQNLFR
jgi:hypothetical protein